MQLIKRELFVTSAKGYTTPSTIRALMGQHWFEEIYFLKENMFLWTNWKGRHKFTAMPIGGIRIYQLQKAKGIYRFFFMKTRSLCDMLLYFKKRMAAQSAWLSG